MPGAVHRRPDQRDLAGAPGGRLVLHDRDRLDLVPRIRGQVLVDLGHLDTLAPVTGDEDHVQAELPGHLRPQASEMPGVEGQHAVARRQRVDERGLPGPGARRGIDRDGSGAAAQPAQSGQHVAGQRGELGTAVVDRGCRHRPQHPVGDIRRPGDLEEVPAALVRHDLSFPRGTDLAEALRRAVGGEVRFDSYTRHLFSRDASMYAIEPVGVVFPRDAADVAAVVATAAGFGVPVLPRGAGTSLAGQTVGHAIVMDLSRHMNTIIEIDAGRRVARVQPGVVQEQLNLAAAQHGLAFGPDTSTSNRATLGGMIGNNSAGSQSVRYGMTIDHVLTLDVVLSDASQVTFGPLTAGELVSRAAAPTLDGTICRELPRLVERHREAIATGFPRFWRQSGGYRLDQVDRVDRLAGATSPARSAGLDLAKFVVGSEGTLVTVVEATVQLVPAPRHRVIAVGHFLSVQPAIEATEDALACQPAAVELLDRTIIELSRQKIEYRALGSILHGDPEALLFVTFFGGSEAEAAAGLDRLDERWQAHGHGYHTLRAVHATEQAALLKVRSAGLGLLMAASTGTRRPLAV